MSKPVYCVQVRELVEFVLRRGDLSGGTGEFVGPGRALAGTRGHQRLQRSRPAGYQKEVRLCHDLEDADFILRIQGRIDGLLPTPGEVQLEEIKTVQGAWDLIADPLHWAQAKIYAFIYAQQNQCGEISVQLTYLNLDSDETSVFQERFATSGLVAFFNDTTAIYLDWIRDWHQWRLKRDESSAALVFPFAQYRPGQRELAKAVYRSIGTGGRLFLAAPTGIGKTVSVLFPAIKALGAGKLERIFYLTARTVGRTVAEKALDDLRSAGLRLRSLTLTAREKLCLQNGRPCDRQTCPLALGYYDRHKAAMREALGREAITRTTLDEISAVHQVCPHALSLDVSSWVDAVVCDYNYVFDPKVYLRRQFDDETGEYGFLVDEAHNLVDRAREMFSAELVAAEVHELARTIKPTLPACARKLRQLDRALRQLTGAGTSEPVEQPGEMELFSLGEREYGSAAPKTFENDTPGLATWKNFGVASLKDGAAHSRPDLPGELLPIIEEAMVEAERWLARNEPAEFQPALLQLYFRLHAFRRTAELYDEHYTTIIESGGSKRIRLFCLDPSVLLRKALARGKTSVFFSATLTPVEYYRTLLGGDETDPVVQLPSPFPPQNLTVLIQDRIRTHLRSRSATLHEVVESIAALIEARQGNYLVYFPSYQYLSVVQERFQARCPQVQILTQRPAMSEAEREAFLAAFSTEQPRSLAGFAVLGGLFAEGIDLAGERLIGVVVVGVGLPQICLERDLIRQFFEAKTGAGFEFAYAFPGLNRVLQASGRVIRSETDRGVVLLIDSRFGEGRYRQRFPSAWQPVNARNAYEIAAAASHFWADS